MTIRTLTRTAGVALFVAAVVAAATTAAEIVTSPYNPTVSLYALDGPVHLVKYIAMLALLVSLPAAYVAQLQTAGKLGLAGLVLVLTGVGLAGTPYNVIELTLSPSLSVAEASAAWEAIWTDAVLLGVASGIGFLAFIIGLVAFGIASRRSEGAFRRAGTISLLALGLAVAQLFAMDVLPAVIPHPPTWLMLGLAAYGWATIRGATTADLRTAARALTPAPERA